jgi:integrase/recombinase XerD
LGALRERAFGAPALDLTRCLAAPDRGRWIGRRDHAFMALAVQTGLRVSALTALRCRDLHLTSAPHVQTLGKGRKERITPLTKQTADTLGSWMRERAGAPDDPLFPTSRGRALSHDAVALRIAEHAAAATATWRRRRRRSSPPSCSSGSHRVKQ